MRRIAERLPPEQQQRLLQDLESAEVGWAAPDRSRVRFELRGYVRGHATGYRPYGVEGTAIDSDGAQVTVLLHADDAGRLFELECIRWADGPLKGPDWQTVEFY